MAAGDVITGSNRAGEATARAVQRMAQDQSKGPVKTHQFRAVTGDPHPFALRHGHALLPREILNKQSGLLARSWIITRIKKPSGQIQFIVSNTAPYAKFLEEGTKTAFARPAGIAVQMKSDGIEARFFEVELTTLLSRRFRG